MKIVIDPAGNQISEGLNKAMEKKAREILKDQPGLAHTTSTAQSESHLVEFRMLVFYDECEVTVTSVTKSQATAQPIKKAPGVAKPKKKAAAKTKRETPAGSKKAKGAIMQLIILFMMTLGLTSCAKTTVNDNRDANQVAADIIKTYGHADHELMTEKTGPLTEDDVRRLADDLQKKGIPFSLSLLMENLPVDGKIPSPSVGQRYLNFRQQLPNRSSEEVVESFVVRPGKPAARDANAELLAMTYATFGTNYGENVSWDFNRSGTSNGVILTLDLWLANAAYSSSFQDQLVEFEPDCIQWLSEVSGGNWLIGMNCPIYVNGVEYGPFDWSNPLVYDPTPSNEQFNECGQLITWTDGNVIGPIGGGVTSISVYNVVAPEYQWTCEE